MPSNAGIFAFDIDFEFGGKMTYMEVFIRYRPDGTHYYHCIINDNEEYDFARSEHGTWVDMQLGITALAEKAGSIIDQELRIEQKN